MKKVIQVKFFFIFCVLLWAGILVPLNVLAVEFPEDSSDQETVVYQDEATDTIQKMSEDGEPAYEAVKDATVLAEDYLAEREIGQGWDKEKKIFVIIGEAIFDSEDPSYDNEFNTKRSLKSMEAVLDAKSKIIEYIRTEMSAVDKATTPGSDINAKFNDDIDMAQRKMEAQKIKLAKLLEQVDQAKAEDLRGATFGDRLNTAMDAAIVKLDKEYNSENIEAKKQKKYEKYKTRYRSSLKEYKDLEKKIKAYAKTLEEESTSTVETISQMPLFGAIPVAQFESWNEDDEQYKVTMVVLWSIKMERVARAFITGENFPIPPGKQTINEWIRGQNWATATGGRRFRDNTGDVYFIGIAALAVGKSSSSETRARGISEQMAKKEVAMSIFADVESYKKASQKMQTRSGGNEKDITNAAETFTRTLQQSIKNRQIHGLQKLYGKKLLHPISQQKIYVSIYGISGKGAKRALLMQERNYLTRILDVKSQQKMKGRTKAYKEKVHEAKQDKSEYYKSKAEASNKIQAKASNEYKQTSKKTKTTQQKYRLQQETSKGGRSQSGAFTGAGKDDDLDW